MTIVAPQNGIMKYVLPDSSSVWLSRGSSITYRAGFIKNGTRDVSLQGEGYFDVKKSSLNPFIVNIDNIDVKVTGTQFNCIKNEDDIEITLVEGSVNILNSAGKIIEKLNPNQQFRFNTTTNATALIDNIDCLQFTAWKDGELYFKNSNLKFVAERLIRLYDINIIIEDEILLDKTITASFKNESIEDIIEIISIILNIEYDIDIINNVKTFIFK